MNKIISKKFAERLIIMLGLISLVLFVNLSDLKLDYSFENFFPANDPDVSFYYNYVDEFETDNDFIIIGLKHHKSIFDSTFLKLTDSLTGELKKIKFIEEVIGPTTLKFPVVGPFGVMQVPYIHLKRPNLYPTDSTRIYESPNLVGSFFSTDGKSVSIQTKHQPKLTKQQNDTVVSAIENLVTTFPFLEAHVAGKIIGQTYFANRLISELILFIGISILLVCVFLYYSFRSIWGIWVPMTVIGLSVLWLLAIMGLTNEPINLMTTLLPTILFVVGISNVVHILERYIYELKIGKTKFEAVKVSFKEVGFATFLTSFTTAVGFLTLNTIPINPVKEFGIYAAIGVLISFILAFTLLPSVLLLAKRLKVASMGASDHIWSGKIHALFMWVLPNRKKIVGLVVFIFLIAGAGISFLKVDNSFIEDWVVSDKVRDDYLFFEKEFSGFRPLEICVWINDTNHTFNELTYLQELDKIEELFKATYQSNFVFSPLLFIKSANQAIHGGKVEFYKLPETEKDLKVLIAKFKSVKIKGLENFLSDDERKARLSCKIIDFGGIETEKINQAFYESLSKKLHPEMVSYKLTGMPLLIDKNNKTLSRNLLLGLFLAFAIIAILMGLLFRSLAMVVVALLPNILPLLLVASIMGAFGIDLKISTAIIFSIAFGIAVDDTIHFMSKFKLELSKGHEKMLALRRTFLQTGKAIMVTSIILTSGFLLLVLSQVPSSFYIGLLISLTLFFALFANLILLPVLIIYLYHPKKK